MSSFVSTSSAFEEQRQEWRATPWRPTRLPGARLAAQGVSFLRMDEETLFRVHNAWHSPFSLLSPLCWVCALSAGGAYHAARLKANTRGGRVQKEEQSKLMKEYSKQNKDSDMKLESTKKKEDFGVPRLSRFFQNFHAPALLAKLRTPSLCTHLPDTFFTVFNSITPVLSLM